MMVIRVQIYSVMDLRANAVELRGAVSRPGNYDLGDSLRLSDLIMKADGLVGDAYMKRVDIVRLKSDFFGINKARFRKSIRIGSSK